MEICPPMQLSDDPEQSARAMNEEIEYFVTPTPEQYVWILQLLRTRKDGGRYLPRLIHFYLQKVRSKISPHFCIFLC